MYPVKPPTIQLKSFIYRFFIYVYGIITFPHHAKKPDFQRYGRFILIGVVFKTSWQYPLTQLVHCETKTIMKNQDISLLIPYLHFHLSVDFTTEECHHRNGNVS